MKTRAGRAPKLKKHINKDGTVVSSYQASAWAILPTGDKLVYASAPTEGGARKAAVQKAYELEQTVARETELQRIANAEASAEAAMHALRSHNKGYDPERNLSIGAIFDEYLQFATLRKRQDSTIERYTAFAGLFRSLRPDPGLPPLGEWLINDCHDRYTALQICHDRMLSDGLAQNTVRSRWTFLRTIGNFAKKRRYTSESPFKLVAVASKQEKGELEIEIEHMSLLMESAHDDLRLRCGLTLAFAFGHRCQEIVGATEDDLKDGRLHVNRQLKRVAYEGEHGPKDVPPPSAARYGKSKKGDVLALAKPKSGKKKMSYVLTPEIEGLLRASLATARETLIWDCELRQWRKVRFLVHGVGGGPVEGQHFRSLYRNLCDRVDVGGVLHDLRALFASDQIVRGTDLAIVSRMLRHGDTQTTERYLRGLSHKLGEVSRANSEVATDVLGLRGSTTSGGPAPTKGTAVFLTVVEGGKIA